MEQNTKNFRKNYFFATLCVFIFFFIVFGFLGVGVEDFPITNGFLRFLVFGLLGNGFSFICCGVILFSRLAEKKGKAFQIVSAVLFPIAFPVIVVLGTVAYFPYGIYNAIKLLQIIKNEKANPPVKDYQIPRNTFPRRSSIGLFKASQIAYLFVCIFSLLIASYFVSYKSELVDGVKIVEPVFRFGFVIAGGALIHCLAWQFSLSLGIC